MRSRGLYKELGGGGKSEMYVVVLRRGNPLSGVTPVLYGLSPAVLSSRLCYLISLISMT